MKESKNKISLEEIAQCSECQRTHLIKDYSRAELVCKDCGAVLAKNLIDHRGHGDRKKWLGDFVR
jgi:transcription initiation factor TFIIB